MAHQELKVSANLDADDGCFNCNISVAEAGEGVVFYDYPIEHKGEVAQFIICGSCKGSTS